APDPMTVLLASTSPRRKQLLALLQIPFEVAEPKFGESFRAGPTAEELVRTIAVGKARSCTDRFPDGLVLGSDTLIALDAESLGKPQDLAEAGSMLRRLRGRDHTVHSAVALCRQRDSIQDVCVESVRVWMHDLSDPEVEAYLRTGEWVGKAGAYSIQGAGGRLIARIDGDYTAAVGLPLRLTATLLAARGVRLPIDVAALYRIKPYSNWGLFADDPMPTRAG
ncbi:MAG: Maf family protein, partial [Nitrospiraceae bacterium]